MVKPVSKTSESLARNKELSVYTRFSCFSLLQNIRSTYAQFFLPFRTSKTHFQKLSDSLNKVKCSLYGKNHKFLLRPKKLKKKVIYWTGGLNTLLITICIPKVSRQVCNIFSSFPHLPILILLYSRINARQLCSKFKTLVVQSHFIVLAQIY